MEVNNIQSKLEAIHGHQGHSVARFDQPPRIQKHFLKHTALAVDDKQKALLVGH